ncbi:unnamed protein product [Closterium sp. NIES-54]
MKGKGVARGVTDSSCPRALQSHAQLRPRPPPPSSPPPWGRRRDVVRGWRMGRQEGICSTSPPHPPFLLHPWGVKDCGAAVGGRGSATPAPPAPPFSYLPLLRVQH